MEHVRQVLRVEADALLTTMRIGIEDAKREVKRWHRINLITLAFLMSLQIAINAAILMAMLPQRN
ncbi:hypothetical protein C6P99_04700 [Burkholderia multivorans]|uniref:Transmembrane protein n=1 Tax=Burkholderia multivorans TaxID=87883 RepID=A0AB37AYV3_9BURK|nr:hypothetical protein C6P99_04700 [Burkholderia multivorans]